MLGPKEFYLQNWQKSVQVHTRFAKIAVTRKGAVGYAPLSFQDDYRCHNQRVRYNPILQYASIDIKAHREHLPVLNRHTVARRRSEAP